jgi:chemotaxis protein CheD
MKNEMMNHIHVGIGEYKISDNPYDTLKTFSLGSCVAVIIYDKVKKIAGLIHIAMPESKIDPERAESRPAYYVDTGLPLLIEAMKKKGAERKNVWIKLAGGAGTMDKTGKFNIGNRNLIAVKRYLWKCAMGPINEDTGGDTIRTVTVSVATGEVTISSGGKKWNL